MSRVTFDISMSLDGFIAAANVRPDEPLGEGGEVLHDWAIGADDRGREVLTRGVGTTGAVICGRRTYDDSLPWWGADGPTGPARRPVFVVTHAEPEVVPEDGVYEFVLDGIGPALVGARRAAGAKGVCVMGGADLGRQFLAAGAVDELQLHVVPVLFGSGTRLFDHFLPDHIRLQVAEVVDTPTATHIRYRIVHQP